MSVLAEALGACAVEEGPSCEDLQAIRTCCVLIWQQSDPAEVHSDFLAGFEVNFGR